MFILLYGENPVVAANAVLLTGARLAGRDGNGGGADPEFVAKAGAAGATVIALALRPEVIVGAGVGEAIAAGVDKGAAEAAANFHSAKLAMRVRNKTTHIKFMMRRNDCRA